MPHRGGEIGRAVLAEEGGFLTWQFVSANWYRILVSTLGRFC